VKLWPCYQIPYKAEAYKWCKETDQFIIDAELGCTGIFSIIFQAFKKSIMNAQSLDYRMTDIVIRETVNRVQVLLKSHRKLEAMQLSEQERRCEPCTKVG
jgi:hypothetical protein